LSKGIGGFDCTVPLGISIKKLTEYLFFSQILCGSHTASDPLTDEPHPGAGRSHAGGTPTGATTTGQRTDAGTGVAGGRSLAATIVLSLALAAFCAAAIAVARDAVDLIVFAITLPVFLSPGWPLAIWYAGRGIDRATQLILAVLFGFVAGGLVYCLLRAAGVSSPAVVLGACVLVVVALTRLLRDRSTPVVTFLRLTRADHLALGALLLLTAAIVGPVFAYVGIPTPTGRAYRAYFIADLFGFMSVVAELIKGHTPPLNPYYAGEPLPYYWMYFTYPAVFAALRGEAPIERGILLTQLVTAATLVSAWYLVLRNLAVSAVAAAWSCAFMLVASSFEGLAFLVISLRDHTPLGAFRYLNVDGLTRWIWNLPPVDGMHRALWYTPQHATAFTCGLIVLATMACAREANSWSRRAADGLLLGAALLFSSFTALLLVGWYAVTEIVIIVRTRFRDWQRWLLSSACAAAIVLGCAALAYRLGMLQPIEGSMIVKLNRYLTRGPFTFAALSFGPMLVLAPFGLRRLSRAPQTIGTAILILAILAALALIGLEAPGHDNTYLPLRTGNAFFLILAVAVGFAIDEVRSWRGWRRASASALAIVTFAAAMPTAALDWYNARDISNIAMNPGGFPWTVHVTPSEQAAMRWIRETLPPAAIVQPDAPLRGRASWALIPAFGQRREAAGYVLFEPNPRRLDRNLAAIDRVFRGHDESAAYDECVRLDIDYLYIGAVEAGIEEGETMKFDSDPQHFRVVHDVHDVKIYKVIRR
jgi:hypothetical protein